MMSLLLIVKGKRLYTQSSEVDEPRLASSDRRFLHLLPRVLLTAEQLEMLMRRRARLTATSDALGEAIRPRSTIVVRRPYGNRRYLVGGTKTTTLGWLVELPPALSMVDVRFTWQIPIDEFAFVGGTLCVIEHEFELRLEGTAGETTSDVFTMGHVPWPDADKWLGGQAPVDVTPYATIGGRGLQPSRNLKVTTTDGVDPQGTARITEKMLLPAISLKRLRSFRSLS